jgi:predicted DNA-binding ribbon-helix-helix protein
MLPEVTSIQVFNFELCNAEYHGTHCISSLSVARKLRAKGLPPILAALPEDTLMKSPVIKRSIVIGGHKTSVSLEDAFWSGLKEIAQGQHLTLSNVVHEIDTNREYGNLSSAIRLFVLDRIRTHVQGVSGDQVGANKLNGGAVQL